jgi:hypothetical protein
VGATAGEHLPAGYHRVEERIRLGAGREVFERAGAAVLGHPERGEEAFLVEYDADVCAVWLRHRPPRHLRGYAARRPGRRHRRPGRPGPGGAVFSPSVRL